MKNNDDSQGKRSEKLKSQQQMRTATSKMQVASGIGAPQQAAELRLHPSSGRQMRNADDANDSDQDDNHQQQQSTSFDLNSRIRLLQSKLHPGSLTDGQMRQQRVLHSNRLAPGENNSSKLNQVASSSSSLRTNSRHSDCSDSRNSIGSDENCASPADTPENAHHLMDARDLELNEDDLDDEGERSLDSISSAASSTGSSLAPTPPPRFSSLIKSQQQAAAATAAKAEVADAATLEPNGRQHQRCWPAAAATSQRVGQTTTATGIFSQSVSASGMTPANPLATRKESSLSSLPSSASIKSSGDNKCVPLVSQATRLLTGEQQQQLYRSAVMQHNSKHGGVQHQQQQQHQPHRTSGNFVVGPSATGSSSCNSMIVGLKQQQHNQLSQQQQLCQRNNPSMGSQALSPPLAAAPAATSAISQASSSPLVHSSYSPPAPRHQSIQPMHQQQQQQLPGAGYLRAQPPADRAPPQVPTKALQPSHRNHNHNLHHLQQQQHHANQSMLRTAPCLSNLNAHKTSISGQQQAQLACHPMLANPNRYVDQQQPHQPPTSLLRTQQVNGAATWEPSAERPAAAAAHFAEFGAPGSRAPLTKAVQEMVSQQQQRQATFVINTPSSRQPIRGTAAGGGALLATTSTSPPSQLVAGHQWSRSQLMVPRPQPALGSVSSASMSSLSSATSSSDRSASGQHPPAALAPTLLPRGHKPLISSGPQVGARPPAAPHHQTPMQAIQPKISSESVLLLQQASPQQQRLESHQASLGRNDIEQPERQAANTLLIMRSPTNANFTEKGSSERAAITNDDSQSSRLIGKNNDINVESINSTATSQVSSKSTLASNQSHPQPSTASCLRNLNTASDSAASMTNEQRCDQESRVSKPATSNISPTRSSNQPAVVVSGERQRQAEMLQLLLLRQQASRSQELPTLQQLQQKIQEQRAAIAMAKHQPASDFSTGDTQVQQQQQRMQQWTAAAASMVQQQQLKQEDAIEHSDKVANVDRKMDKVCNREAGGEVDAPSTQNITSELQQQVGEIQDRKEKGVEKACDVSRQNLLATAGDNVREHEVQSRSDTTMQPVAQPRAPASSQVSPSCQEELSIVTNTGSYCSPRIKSLSSIGQSASLLSSPAHSTPPASILSDSTTLITEAAMNSSELIPKLIERLDRKLVVMKEEQLSLMREVELNEASGQRLYDSMRRRLTATEFDKITMHANEIEKVTKLILSLKLRLKRVESELKDRTATNHDEQQVDSTPGRNMMNSTTNESFDSQTNTSESHEERAPADQLNTSYQRQHKLAARSLRPPPQQKDLDPKNQLLGSVLRGVSDPTGSTSNHPKRNHQHHASLQLNDETSSSAVGGQTADGSVSDVGSSSRSSPICSSRGARCTHRDSGCNSVSTLSAKPSKCSSDKETNSSSSDSIFNCADSAIGSTSFTAHGGSSSNIEQPATSQSSLSSVSSTHSSLDSSAGRHRRHCLQSDSPSQHSSHLSSSISVSSHSSMSSVPNSPPLVSPAARVATTPSVTTKHPPTSISDANNNPSNNVTAGSTSAKTANSPAGGDHSADDIDLLFAKRTKLISQLEEAHQLEDCIADRNKTIVQRILKKYYEDDGRPDGEIAEFKQFCRLKSLLLKDSHDVSDRIDNAELQLLELRKTELECNAT